jgi:hypothetical protein
MKIFVFSTHNFWPNHRETELEIIQSHLDKGDEVYRFYCDAHLPVCDGNLNHSLLTCLECRSMRIIGTRLLNGSIKEYPLISRNGIEKAKSFQIPEINSVSKLESLFVDNFDVGFAVMCSVSTTLRESNPDFEIHKEVVKDFLISSIKVYYSAIEYINKIRPDLVYTFNGRFAHVKAVWRAAQRCSVNCVIHERGYNKFHYALFENTTPHDKEYMLRCMIDAWDAADPEKRIEVADAFYKNRLGGKEQGWYSFITKQVQGLLPQNWKPEKRNIIIFHTSEDEFANVGPEWKNYLYTTQIEGITKIVTDMSNHSDIHFYLRVHPNLSGLNNSEVQAIGELSFENLTVIEAESTISSYDLLFNCEKVISFGSTVGIEATYWNKSSIQLGHAYYNDLSVTYRPLKHELAIQLIAEHLEPKPREGCLIYGYFFNSFGIPFKHYVPRDLFNGEYVGKNIAVEPSQLAEFYRKYYYEKFFHRVFKNVERDFRKKKRKLPLPDWIK